ncbi:dihydroneopterin aldolase [Afifella pfennigii]|uniref:dihydroneopterin aldolase n=1 Tax=Afifella pfennigii TaxID=209897 RepID=UPI00047BC39E|nr:dihydroneopterin aldolase [Afifella pfennigii]
MNAVEEVLLAARGRRETEGDVVFLTDYVLAVRIGAYRHERHGPQQVRFDMAVATPARPPLAPGEVVPLCGVLSYDRLVEAIEATVAEGHFDLVETLAERIAEKILQEPLAECVSLRIEKLELKKARAGTIITRRRD